MDSSHLFAAHRFVPRIMHQLLATSLCLHARHPETIVEMALVAKKNCWGELWRDLVRIVEGGAFVRIHA
jgi:hypothetical protein